MFVPARATRVLNLLKDPNNPKIKIPSNLSIIATINTSDESIYYLDSAFKRRWDWEYIEASKKKMNYNDVPKEVVDCDLVIDEYKTLGWSYLIFGLNDFIRANHQLIRKIEDKQVGWWFIKPQNEKITYEDVRDKLMFYLWDSVFTRDKRPLESILQEFTEDKNIKLITYADFISYTVELMEYFHKRGGDIYSKQLQEDNKDIDFSDLF